MTRLPPVPSSPNAVSSRADAGDRQHYVAPLATTLDAVKAEMAKLPRTTLVGEADGYLHYVCVTAVMRFRDDVEFEADGDVVHVRSASRLGYSDLGVNRKRVEQLRGALG